jgi:hypothetical protein
VKTLNFTLFTISLLAILLLYLDLTGATNVLKGTATTVLQMKRGTALNSFKSLLWFLAVFQLSRIFFIKLTGREYVTPSIGGSSDLFEDKKPELADFIMFAILFFTIIAAQGV